MRISPLRYSVALTLLTLAVRVNATSIFEFDKWMQRVEKRALSVQKSLERKDIDASAVDAKEIESLYQLMQKYFEEQGDADQAVDLSRKGREAAAEVAVLANDKRFEAASATMKNLMIECRTCHHAYKPLY